MAHRSAVRSIERVVHETTAPTDPDLALERVVAQLRRGNVLVITGAGVSTDSGIPDYRSAGGRLTKGRPMTYQEFAHSPAQVHRYWARAFVGMQFMRAAAPNRTHFALVELERAGLADTIQLAMHDELVVNAAAQEEVRRVMETAPDWLTEFTGHPVVLRTDTNPLPGHWAYV